MMATSHMMFGGACWAAYSAVTGSPVGAELSVAVIASLLPDIDHPESKFGRLVPFISYPISYLLGHRGITHSLFAIICMIAVFWLYGINESWVAAAAIGYLSHLIGDLLTGGVPLFWPVRINVKSPITIQTNGIFEPILVTVLLVSLLWISGVDLSFVY